MLKPLYCKQDQETDWGWSKDPGPSDGGEVPRLSFFPEDSVMKELSVFIDESGDFGEYDDQAPCYIITMVFHDQSLPITDAVQKPDQEISCLDLNNLCIHTGPIVRREEIQEFIQ